MTVIKARPDCIIELGYEGEDSVSVLSFPYTEDWLSDGEGHFDVRVLRHGETEAYNAVSVTDDRENMRLLMTVTDVELSIKGYGEMQVVYSGTDFVRKSPVYRYNVSRAIDGEIVNPPEGSIINQLVRDLAAIKETKADKTTATASSDGLMSAQDKTRLDAIYEDYSSALTALGGGS